MVEGGLTLKNLKFDAIDSSIQPSIDANKCLKQPGLCCYKENGQLKGANSCVMARKPSEECPFSIGATFIEFNIDSQTSLTSPPTLTIENCQFNNFDYEINSFIELNDLGGHVVLKNSAWNSMNSCGSVIRNKRYLY